MERTEIAITGAGIISTFGNDVGGFFDALATGQSNIKAGPRKVLRGQQLPASFSARVEGFNPGDWISPQVVEGSDRFAHLAVAACQLAVKDAGLGELDPVRTAIVFGTSMGGSHSLIQAQHLLDTVGPEAVPPKLSIKIWPNMAAAQIAMMYDLHGPCLTVCTACASGVDAVGNAARLLWLGLADVAIVGGCEGGGDSDFVPASAVSGGISMSSKADDARFACRPYDRDRTGIAGGDGAAFLILESAAHAKARGANVKGMVAGYANLADGYHPSSPEPTGKWEALVMRNAQADAAGPLKGRQISAIYGHGTGTIKGDAAEIRAINTVFDGYPEYPPVASLKGAIGHSGASSAIFNMIAGLEGMKRGMFVPTASTNNVDPEVRFPVPLHKAIALDIDVMQFNAFGFGGQDASLIITEPH